MDKTLFCSDMKLCLSEIINRQENRLHISGLRIRVDVTRIQPYSKNRIQLESDKVDGRNILNLSVQTEPDPNPTPWNNWIRLDHRYPAKFGP